MRRAGDRIGGYQTVGVTWRWVMVRVWLERRRRRRPCLQHYYQFTVSIGQSEYSRSPAQSHNPPASWHLLPEHPHCSSTARASRQTRPHHRDPRTRRPFQSDRVISHHGHWKMNRIETTTWTVCARPATAWAWLFATREASRPDSQVHTATLPKD